MGRVWPGLLKSKLRRSSGATGRVEGESGVARMHQHQLHVH